MPVLLIATLLIVAALILFAPKGAAPETVPIIGIVAAVLLSVTDGMAYASSLMKNSGELYRRWLERRFPSGPLQRP